jgi:hypothetical protein
MNTNNKNEIIIFTNNNGEIELRADIGKDTLWAKQDQIARLFEIERSVVTKHINNILKDGEIEQKSNVQKMHIANSDKPITLYSLDIILAVGYRTSSRKAIIFRKWATTILRNYLTKGYSLNKYTLENSDDKFDDLHEAIAFMESKKDGEEVKGKMTIKLTKNLVRK